MADDTSVTVADEQVDEPTDEVEVGLSAEPTEELLVEEVSIDGMCGVY